MDRPSWQTRDRGAMRQGFCLDRKRDTRDMVIGDLRWSAEAWKWQGGCVREGGRGLTKGVRLTLGLGGSRMESLWMVAWKPRQPTGLKKQNMKGRLGVSHELVLLPCKQEFCKRICAAVVLHWPCSVLRSILIGQISVRSWLIILDFNHIGLIHMHTYRTHAICTSLADRSPVLCTIWTWEKYLDYENCPWS